MGQNCPISASLQINNQLNYQRVVLRRNNKKRRIGERKKTWQATCICCFFLHLRCHKADHLFDIL
jgi:hypothetical protein